MRPTRRLGWRRKRRIRRHMIALLKSFSDPEIDPAFQRGLLERIRRQSTEGSTVGRRLRVVRPGERPSARMPTSQLAPSSREPRATRRGLVAAAVACSVVVAVFLYPSRANPRSSHHPKTEMALPSEPSHGPKLKRSHPPPFAGATRSGGGHRIHEGRARTRYALPPAGARDHDRAPRPARFAPAIMGCSLLCPRVGTPLALGSGSATMVPVARGRKRVRTSEG